MVKAAEPTLFLTLTKAGKTVEEAARALTTFLQHLRRSSKGRGPNHLGAREAYPVEYFAVLERHQDFEANGFHWHLLVKGMDFIPHEVLKEAWRSARHGVAYIVDVQAVRTAFEFLAPGLDELAIRVKHHHGVRALARRIHRVVHIDAPLRVFAHPVRVAVFDFRGQLAPVVVDLVSVLAFPDDRPPRARLIRRSRHNWPPSRTASRN